MTSLAHHLLTVTKADAPFLVDLRVAEAFAKKAIMGSQNIPFETLLAHKTTLLQQPKILLLAESDTLAQAEEAYLILTALGAKQVSIIPNGFSVCKQAKLSVAYPANANVKAITGWFNTLTPAEKAPTLLGLALLLIALFSGKHKGLLLGISFTTLGFGLRNKIKADKAGSLLQWLVTLALKKVF
jgi:rhodanese-related sulfurtransferase